MRWCGCGGRSTSGPDRARRALGGTPGAQALAQRLELADQQVQMRAFFVGELEEDLLAFRVLEALAVALEELVRAALAADPDEQRLLVVHAALAQLFGALREQTAGRALEEEERRPRLEQRILRDQLLVALLQRAQVLFLLFGQ